MGVRVNYAKVTKRIAAYLVDQTTFLVCCSFFFLLISFILPEESLTNFFNYVFSDTDTDTGLISERHEILGDLGILLDSLVYIALEVLMITKLGWTPGKLLLDMYIKDANTLQNAALMQVVTRSTLKALLFIPVYYISEWFLILPILILVPSIFDQRKQLFYDKIANTVVVDYKPEECHLNLNYVGITRRAIAYIIDHLITIGISLVLLVLVGAIFHIAGFKLFITRSCLSFLLSIVFGVFMIKRSGSTPGQSLCGIHIKDADTLNNITLIQAIIRYVSLEVISFILSSLFIMDIFFFNKYISKWWSEPLSDLTFTAIILIFICGIFDRRKQFLHDKIAKTVAVKKKAEAIVINKPKG
ncbi:RDD family protein [Wolbachia endosymbiont (group B) of Athalia cordata]|uniref:RDD family protein n=1 Tax=Wolbachia endosymbiont (group B) of Athalia cordata TaxID=2953986 RepID=UPI0022315FB9|nr:RDD family protein [Wolbachia endosymbiont (group B) of Athalia cordata]